MPTLEEILNNRFQSNIGNVNQRTAGDISSPITKPRPRTFAADETMSSKLFAAEQEKSMYEAGGSGLWDFTREFGEGLVDTASFGLISAFTDWEPTEGRETEAAKWGGDIGTALGFLHPFMRGKQVVSATARRFAGKASGKRIGQKIADDTKKAFKDDDSAINFFADKGSHKNFDSVIQKDITKLGMFGAFKKHVLDDALLKPIKNFDDAFGSATARKNFFDQVDDEGMRALREYAAKKGFQVTDDAAKSINGIVKDAIGEAGGRPIGNLAGLVARKLGDGKKASFYSHMFEEAIVFAAVDNVLHGIDAVAGEVEWDPLSTTTHALALGHVLGAVRFIPGGIAGGTTGIMKLNPMERIKTIISQSSATGYNLNSRAGQAAVGKQFEILGNIHSTSVGGVEVNRLLHKFIVEGGEKGLTRRHKKLLEKLGIDEFDVDTLMKLLKEGTKQQRRDVADLMAQSVRHIHGQAKKEWRGEFLKAVRQDLIGGGEGGIGSMPRMFAGGIAMAGGPGILFDETLTPGDKARALLIGAFLLKHGKELTYKDYNTKTWERYEGTFTFGRKPLGSFSETFQSMDNLIKTLGGKMEGKDATLWSNLEMQMLVDSKANLYHGNQEGYSNMEVIDGVVKIMRHSEGKDIKYQEKNEKGEVVEKTKPAPEVFTTDLNKPINQEQAKRNDLESEAKKIPNESGWSQVYNHLANGSKFDSVIGEGRRPKLWSELSPNQRVLFIKLMQKGGYKPGKRGVQKLEDLFHDANVDFLNQAHDTMLQGVKDIIRDLDVDVVPYEVNGEIYTLRKIDVMSVAGKLNEVALWKVNEYNNMVERITKRGKHKLSDNKIKLSEANFPSSAKLEAFIKTSEKYKIKVNDHFKIGEESRFEFSDGWFKESMDYANLYEINKQSLERLNNWVENNGDVVALLRAGGETGDIAAIVSKVNIKGEGSKIENMQRRMNDLVEAVRLTNRSSGIFKEGSTKEITVEQAQKIFDSLEKNGEPIYGFKAQHYAEWDAHLHRKAALSSFRTRLLDNVLIRNEKGEKVELSDENIMEIEYLEDNNVIIPGTHTARPFARELFDINQALQKVDSLQLKIEKIEDLIPKLREVGADETTIKSVEEILNIPDMNPRDFRQILKDYNKYVEKYIKKPDGTGFLEWAPGEKIAMTQSDLVALTHSLEAIQNGIVIKTRKRMLAELREDIIRNGGNPKAVDEVQAKKYLLSTLEQGNLSGKDALDVVALASEWGIYDYYNNKFKQPEGTTWNNIFQQLKQMVSKDWSNSESIIESRYKELLRVEGIDPKDYNKTDMNAVLVNNKWGKFAENVDSTASHQQQLQQKFVKDYNSDMNKFASDLIKDFKENNPDARITETELAHTLTSFLLDANSNLKIKRYTFNDSKTTHTTHKYDTIKHTPVLNRMRDIIGPNAQIAMLNYDGVGFNRNYQSLSDSRFRANATDSIYHGKYRSQDAMFDILSNLSKSGNTPYFEYQYGKNKYKYLIEKTSASVDFIGKNYVKYLQDLVKKDIITDTQMTSRLIEDLGFRYEQKTNEYIWDVPADSKTGNYRFNQMMNDMVIGEMIGNKKWWGLEKSEKLHAGIMKRLGMFDNIAAKKYTKENIEQMADFVSSNPQYYANAKEISQSLKGFAKGEWKELLLADEGGNQQWEFGGTQLGVADLHSVLKQEVKNLQDIKDAATVKATKDAIQKEIDKLNEDIAAGVMSDASNVNGITFVSDRVFRALGALVGNMNPEVGGIKPLVIRTGEGQMFINKTAMVRKQAIKELFEANPGVEFITFTSASKKVVDYDIPITESSEFFGGGKIDAGKHHTIRPENLQLLSSKDFKNEATIGINHTAELSSDSKPAFYEYVYGESIKNLKDNTSTWKNPRQWLEQISIFKFWSKSKQQEKGASEIDSATLGLIEVMAENGIHPGILPQQFQNLYLKNEILPLFKKKLPGGQGVLVPDIDVTGRRTLRDTIVVGGKIYDFGEIALPEGIRSVTVDKQNMTVIKRETGKADSILELKDVPGLLKEQFNNIGELYDVLQQKKYKDYQVMVVGERQPHTKVSSIMPTALKGFIKGEGNVVALNQSDLKRAAEGDFDIDTINYFWNMPHVVMKDYVANRPLVADSRKISVGNTPSYKGLDLKDPNTINSYRDKLAHADVMRGVTMKTVSMLSKLLNNQSSEKSQYKKFGEFERVDDVNIAPIEKTMTNVKGFVMRLPDNRYIALREDLKPTYQEIADMNQHILDSENGYNTTLFRDSNSIYDKIFFGENGIFQVYKMNSYSIETKSPMFGKVTREVKGLQKEPGATLDSKEKQAIMDNILIPYRDLMSSANYFFDAGKQKSPTLNNLLRQIKEFNSDMNSAEYNMAKDLGLKYEDVKGTLLGGYGDKAKITGDRTGENFSETTMMFDRLLAEILHTGETHMSLTRREMPETSVADGRTLDNIMISQEMMSDFKSDVKKSGEKWDLVNTMENRIRELKKLKNKAFENDSVRLIQKKIERLEEKKNEIKDNIVIEKGFQDKIVENMMKVEENKFYRKHNRYMKAEELEAKKKALKEQVKKGKTVVDEIAYDHEFVHALGLVEGFGRYTNLNFREIGMDRTFYIDLSNKARGVRKDFGQAWSDFRNGRESKFEVEKNPIDWVNEAHIYEYFLNRMRQESNDFSTMQEQNIYLAKIMTPKVDFSKVVKFRGNYFPSPESKRIEKYITLGLRYNQQFYKGAMANNFLKMMTKSYEQSYKFLMGDNTAFDIDMAMPELSRVGNESSFYFDPFSYAVKHGRSDFLSAMNPAGIEYSRLSGYQQMHKLFGTGLIRDNVNLHIMNSIPVGAVGNVGRHSRSVSLGGLKNLQEAMDMENRAFIINEGQNSIFDFGQQLYNFSPYGTSKKGDWKKPSKWTRNQNKKNKRWCD